MTHQHIDTLLENVDLAERNHAGQESNFRNGLLVRNRMILALTGWSCKKVQEAQSAASIEVNYLECTACFFRYKIGG